jgi:hypothetical protein
MAGRDKRTSPRHVPPGRRRSRSAGFIVRNLPALFEEEAPRAGYATEGRHVLKPGMVVFFKCAAGGYARMKVERLIAAASDPD